MLFLRREAKTAVCLMEPSFSFFTDYCLLRCSESSLSPETFFRLLLRGKSLQTLCQVRLDFFQFGTPFIGFPLTSRFYDQISGQEPFFFFNAPRRAPLSYDFSFLENPFSGKEFSLSFLE